MTGPGFAEALRYCFRDSVRNGGQNIILSLLLAVLIAALVAYSLALPSFLAQKKQSTQTIEWDVRCFFEVDSQNNYEGLKGYLSEHAGAVAVPSLNSNAALSVAEPTQEGESTIKAVDVHMLHANDQGILPIDAYSGTAAVIKGNPRKGQGTIVDAMVAQRYQLQVGDCFYLGMEVPEGSSGSSELEVSVRDDVSGESQTEQWSSCSWFAFQVDAIVVPDDNFSGIGCIRPEQNIDALWASSETYATELLVFGNEAVIGDAIEHACQDVVDDQCYVDKGSSLVRQARDEYLVDKSSTQSYCMFLMLLGGAVFACLVVDAIRKTRRRSEGLSVFRSLGMSATSLVRAAALEELGMVLILVTLSCLGGFYWVDSTFSIWVSPAYKVVAFGVLGATAFVSSLFQAVLTGNAIRESSSSQRVWPAG